MCEPICSFCWKTKTPVFTCYGHVCSHGFFSSVLFTHSSRSTRNKAGWNKVSPPPQIDKGRPANVFLEVEFRQIFFEKTLNDERNAPRCPQWWSLCVCTSQHRGQRGDLVDLHRFTLRSSKIAMENLQSHGGLVRWGNQRTKWKIFHCHGADLRRLVGRSDLVVSTHPIIWANGIENMENSWKH